MTSDSYNTGRPTIAELVSDAVRNTTRLFSSEIGLLKAETKASVRQVAVGLVLMLLGVVFAVVGLTLIVESAVAALAVYLNSEALAAGIIAVATLVISGILFVVAMNKFSNFSLTPERTIRSVRKDAEVVSEKVT